MNSMVRWLLAEFGSAVYTSDGRDIRVNCPFCPDQDRKQHLYISLDRPVVHCFRCEWRGSHFELVKHVGGAESYAEVYRIIERGHVSLNDFNTLADRLKPISTQQTLPDKIGNEAMPTWFRSFRDGVDGFHTRLILRYALKRASPSTLLKYGFGYCADLDQSRWLYRLIMPVEADFYQGRSITNAEPKYLSPDVPIGDKLFNSEALGRPVRRLYVAEGIMSAIALGPDAVAVLGKRASQLQADRIAEEVRADEIVIAFDADATFGQGVFELADRLVSRGHVVVIREYAEGDPDSSQVWREEFYGLRYKVYGRLHDGAGNERQLR